MASGVVVVVVVVVVGACNCSQMRTSKCTCLIFGVSIGLDPGQKCTKGIFDRLKLKVTRHIADHLWVASIVNTARLQVTRRVAWFLYDI